MYEPPVISDESQESPDGVDRPRGWPVQYCLDFKPVYDDTRDRDDVA
jgi:hypothetical protein